MTNRQIKFLIAIYKSGKTAEELCKELKIKPYDNDKFGGCYNALNTDINYLTSDDGNEIDSMFRIVHSKEPIPNHDTYIITADGRKYVEDYMMNKRYRHITEIIGIVAIIVAIAIAVVQKMI